jgi:hypothetical protein
MITDKQTKTKRSIILFFIMLDDEGGCHHNKPTSNRTKRGLLWDIPSALTALCLSSSQPSCRSIQSATFVSAARRHNCGPTKLRSWRDGQRGAMR